MGRFVVFMSFMMVTYTFILSLASDVLRANINPSAITVPDHPLVGRALRPDQTQRAAVRLLRRDLAQLAAGVSRVALLHRATCALTTLFKAALIWGNAAFADEPLFSLSGILDPRTSWPYLQLASFSRSSTPSARRCRSSSSARGCRRRCGGVSSGPQPARARSWCRTRSSRPRISTVDRLRHRRVLSRVAGAPCSPAERNIAGVAVSHVLCGWFAFLVLDSSPGMRASPYPFWRVQKRTRPCLFLTR